MCCTPRSPRSASADFNKGLNTEPAELCLDGFLGDRRRRAPHGSPWASPGSSPWASATNSPRQQNSPPGTPPRAGSPPRAAASGAAALSWSAVGIAPDNDNLCDAEGIKSSSPLPTWSEGSPVSLEKRQAAVMLHRPNAPGKQSAAIVSPPEWKYRSRDFAKQKIETASKFRWRA